MFLWQIKTMIQETWRSEEIPEEWKEHQDIINEAKNICNNLSDYTERIVEIINENEYPRFIVCAAVLMRDMNVIHGIRHYSPDMRFVLKSVYGPKYHLEVEEEGFVDQFGMFVSRRNAWKIAKKRKQIRRGENSQFGNVDYDTLSDNAELYSENLY